MEHPAASPVPEARRLAPTSTIDLLDLFWRRRRYFVVCTLLAVFAGALYCQLATPMYESSADVLVVHKRPRAVTGDSQYESGFEDYLATHLAIITSPLIVQRAITADDLGSLESFADYEFTDEELTDVIVSSLEVEGGSRELGENADSIMTLSFQGPVPEECPIIVQAILDSYEAFHEEVYFGMSDSTVELIEQARDMLQNDLTKQEETYNLFRQSSPLVARGTDEVNPLQDRLTSIEEQRSEVILRRAQVERQRLALERAKQEGTDRRQLLAMVADLRQQATADDTRLAVSSTVENQLIQLVDDEQRLLEHYGPSHPHVAMIRQRIAAMQRFFALPTAAHVSMLDPQLPSEGERLVDTDRNVVDVSIDDPVSVYENYLNQEINRLEIAETVLGDLYNREHEAAKEHSIFQLKDDAYRRGVERTEALYDEVINRLQEASLVKDFGGFETRVVAPPREGEKVSPARTIVLSAAFLAGMFMASMIALLAEFRDGSFQSMDQIEQHLAVPVVGQIPEFLPATSSTQEMAGETSPAPTVCSFHQPRSRPAESIRALRTALLLDGHQNGSQVMQVTGISASEGASTVAANLAVSLAQAGRRVLVVDADLSQPRQHELLGVERANAGLASVIVADAELDDLIQSTAVENLWLLPADPQLTGPCEIFTSPRFGELIRLLRERYDDVIIDTEPLAVSADACLIATKTDGVLLALKLKRDSRTWAKRAKRLLDRLPIRLAGVVVNGVTTSLQKQLQMNPLGTEQPLYRQELGRPTERRTVVRSE